MVRDDGTVEVRAPFRASEKAIDEFVARKHDWIEKRLAEQNAAQTRAANRYVEGGIVRFLGVDYSVQIEQALFDGVSVVGEQLVVSASGDVSDEDDIETIVNAWLHEQACVVLTEEYLLACKRFGLADPPRLRLRDMRSRWGSYSPKTHRVCLNMRLIAAPREAISMVCIHELCHVENQSHDASFYIAMDRYQNPGWREVSRNLKRELF
jgi:predicted metal-dependent hydrolase